MSSSQWPARRYQVSKAMMFSCTDTVQQMITYIESMSPIEGALYSALQTNIRLQKLYGLKILNGRCIAIHGEKTEVLITVQSFRQHVNILNKWRTTT